MIRLVLQLSLWIASVVFLCFLAIGSLLMPPPGADRWLEQLVLDAGLAELVTRLEEAPPEERAALLAAAPQTERLGLVLHPSPGPGGPPGHHRGTFPLRDGAAVLTMHPAKPPIPDRESYLAGFLGAVLIVFAASATAALPVAWRLAVVEAGMERLHQGELAARVPDARADLIGRLGRGFNRMAGGLERMVRDREALLQAVAHEYGTPLSRLSLELELLAARLDPPLLPRLERMRRELRELDRLTSELMTWVELEAPGPSVGFDLVEAVRAEIERLDDARLVFSAAAAPVEVRGDERHLRRAVGNLLRNAARYAQRRVEVGVVVGAAEVELRVDDDGPGIPAADRERIFEPFTRLDEARDRARGGAGLGLAIVRRVAERARGRVVAEASPLGGARLRLVWPLA